MPTVTILGRSDLFPPGTVVGVYPPRSGLPGRAPSGGGPITTGTVDAAGNLTVTNAGVLQGRDYVLYALVNGAHTYLSARSTLDTMYYDFGFV